MTESRPTAPPPSQSARSGPGPLAADQSRDHAAALSNDSKATAAATHARLLIRTLVHAGVNHFVISPGSRSTPLVLAIAAMEADAAVSADSGLTNTRATSPTPIGVHVVLDERVAGFVALGIARASGRPVAVVCSSGSAGANLLPAVVEASASRAPLVILTADRPAPLHHVGAAQTTPQTRLFGADFVRWAATVAAPVSGTDPTWAGALALQAVERAVASPPGPVHLNVPYAKPLWALGATAAPLPIPERLGASSRRAAEPGLAERLIPRLIGRGVIICGPYAGRNPALFETLATRLGWPIVAEPGSGLRFGASRQGPVISHADCFLRAPEVARALRPARILRFGHAPTSKRVEEWSAGVPTILVDPDGRWHEPSATAELLVRAPAEALAVALSAALSPPRPSPPSAGPAWLARWRRIDDVTAAALWDRPDGAWEGSVARQVAAALSVGVGFHVANSMPIRDLESFATALGRPLRVYVSRGVNGIDGTVSTALGEALGSDQPVVLLTGDLALRHDIGGLVAAASRAARLVVVVVDNAGGGIFGMLPICAHKAAFERFFVTPPAVPLGPLCTGTGACTAELDPTQPLALAIAAALEAGGTHVLRVPVDREESRATCLAALAAGAAAALRALDAELAP